MTIAQNSALQANVPTRRQLLAGTAVAFGGLAFWSSIAFGQSAPELSNTAESIHEEQVFNASPARVYDALTVTAQFDKVSKLSVALRGGMPAAAKPTVINRVPGGAFSLFGGYVIGRNIELVPGKRVVQAWRAASWKPGVYSIVKFEIVAQGSGTKLIFDQAGFPQDDADHLVAGWHDNYWNPMVRFLTTP